MAQKVVAHFLDRRIVKGTSVDIDPLRATCHIHTGDQGIVEVELAKLKALYFVKDFAGRPEYRETRAPDPLDARLRGSHHVHLTFHDGECQTGLMNRHPPNRQFFFVLPIDAQSNNIRILVNRAALLALRADGVTASRPSAAGEWDRDLPKVSSG